ncbi:hypothetical protein SteCoe_36067 [Stentor coeruleus]|uniref:Uncharacterized protein n=1 Tax=Stentor coeruleus TaxID=5963 RepID=A0A1R2AR58_9CILI|nr:hypothetical protein SteCoe_36067 [Stentor coeruleus]
MKSFNTYSKSFDFKNIKTDDIEILSKYFHAPLPNLITMDKDPEELKDSVYSFLNEQRKKAIKAVKLAKSLQALSENSYKTIKYLESTQESLEYKLEQFDTDMSEYEKELHIKDKKIEELTKDLEELEKNLHEVTQERECLKKDIQTLKKSIKQQESISDQVLALERKKFLKEKDEDIKKLENLRIEIMNKEKMIEESETQVSKFEYLLKQEKHLTEKLRNDIDRYKSDIFELKNKFDESKLKKSKYKDLYQELKALKSLHSKFKNNSTQTSSMDLDESEDEYKIDEKSASEKDQSEINDLISLEEAQSNEYNGDINLLETNELFSLNNSGGSVHYKESMIYIIPSRKTSGISETKMTIENCDKILIPPIKIPEKSQENLQVLPGIIQCARIQNGRIVKLGPGSPKLTPKGNMKFCFNGPATPKARVLKMETWTESVVTSPSRVEAEASNIEVSNTEVKNEFENRVEAEANYEGPKDDENNKKTRVVNKENLKAKIYKDPVKEYFLKVCQNAKAACRYSDKIVKIPTNSLYNKLVEMKIPYCKWPESVQEYLAKRIQQR